MNKIYTYEVQRKRSSSTPYVITHWHLRQVSEPSLVGHQGSRSSIFLPVGWLREVNLLKLERILGLQRKREKKTERGRGR